jgi:succinate-semialdehyde dehydrogenase/glutarate-semialdehyde dehydrogenase
MSISETLTDKLNDVTLLRSIVKTESTDSKNIFDVRNPANGDVVATLPQMTVAETSAIIKIAKQAQVSWAARTGKDRGAILRNFYDLIVEHTNDLATILTMEMGKPLAEARGEILYGASFIEWFSEEAKRIYGDTIPGHQPDHRIMVMKQPVGVVAAITPWNFPNAMITRKIGPALAVGCAVVCKPAAETPLSALALGELAQRAGIPSGVFNIITSNLSAEIGIELCNNPMVRKLTFTGSTEVGRTLMHQCANQIKKLSLELGGNAPFIVFDDADIDQAVAGAMISKYRNAGQTCVCANRIYVQSGVYDEFTEKLLIKVSELKIGDGFSEGVTIGPLIDDSSLEKVEILIQDAIDKGSKVIIGGKRKEGKGRFFQPTVMTEMSQDMRIAKEETFGPVAPIFRFETLDDVIFQANDTEFGLASYFYANDLTKVWKVVEALEYGMVGVNTGLISTEVAPFGGIKQSGLGREGSKYGVDDYLEMKYVCLGHIS